MKSFKHFIQSLSEVFQGTQSECMKMCKKLGHSQEECEKRWCSKSNVSIQEGIMDSEDMKGLAEPKDKK